MWRTCLVSVLMLLFFLRLALPQYIKFLLFPLLAITGIVAFVYSINNQERILQRSEYKVFTPFVLVSLFYIVSFLFTAGKQDMLIKDFVNVFTVFVFTFITVFFINSDQELTFVISLFKRLAIIASTIIAFLGLIKLYFQLYGVEFGFLKVGEFEYPIGATLAVDNSFFTLICLFGIILSLDSITNLKTIFQRFISQASLLILLFNIFFSTSRRGIIIAFVILFGFVVIWIFSFIFKNDKLKQFRKNSTAFGFTSILMVSSVICLLVFVPPFNRNKRVSFSKFNKAEVHSFINLMTLSVFSILNGETNYRDINRNIWNSNFDPHYPYCGWASGNYKVMSELVGEGSEIVPVDALGAKIDSTVGGSTLNGNSYYYDRLFDKEVDSGKRYIASVYCYVSSDFNGDWLRIRSSGEAGGFNVSYYDISHKGRWQKMETSFYADSDKCSAFLFISKLNSISFNNLRGYVVFAYPELKEIGFDPMQPISWAGAQFEEVSNIPGDNAEIVPDGSSCFKFSPYAFVLKDSLRYAGSDLFTLTRNEKDTRNVISIYVWVSKDFNGDEVYLRASGNYNGLGFSNFNMKNKGKWEKLFLSITPGTTNVSVKFYVKQILDSKSDTLKGTVLFAYPENQKMEFDPQNPISWAATEYKEVRNLPGENSGIVPENTIGYLIDHESNFTLFRSSMKYVTSTTFGVFPIKKNKRYISSVYCYVSSNFNGELVRLGAKGHFYGSRYDFYNLNRKGTWQKLSLNNYGDSGYVAPNLVFEIPPNRAVNFLKGYVIFAYPEEKVLDFSSTSPDSNTNINYLRKFKEQDKMSSIESLITRFYLKNSGKLVAFDTGARVKITRHTSCIFPFINRQVSDFCTLKGHATFTFQVIEKSKSPEKEISYNVKSTNKEFKLIEKAGIFSFLHDYKEESTVEEDTLSDIPKFQKEMENDNFAGPRLDRWRYALYIYQNEYSPVKKLIGGGFRYTLNFARMFDNEDRDYDYPHNPFLSVLLYSGVIGLLAYFWFIYKAVYYYWLYRREYWQFALCYAVAFFFAFFSTLTPFDPAIVGIFGILPYFIHYYHIKKEEKTPA